MVNYTDEYCKLIIALAEKWRNKTKPCDCFECCRKLNASIKISETNEKALTDEHS